MVFIYRIKCMQKRKKKLLYLEGVYISLNVNCYLVQAICSTFTGSEASIHSWAWKECTSFTGKHQQKLKYYIKLIWCLSGLCAVLKSWNLTSLHFTLQAEGSEVSAELEFLNQQNLILSMENKALKQRLENLAQEQLIKYCKLDIPSLSDSFVTCKQILVLITWNYFHF